jgi:hypothetical protein
MELTWKASESASALYAAKCMSDGLPVADARLAEAFAPALDFALAEFVACGAPADRLLPILTALAARGADDNRQLVEQAIAKTVGRGMFVPATIGRLATSIGGLKAAFQNAYRATVAADSPPLVDELTVLGRPLLAQWEAHGPGLLSQIARSTEQNVVAAGAEVVLVYPLVGGNGFAYRALNAVTIEATPTDPCAELPEVVRLAWLLSQLNLDLPAYADRVLPANRDMVGRWATIPPVLAAAEYVGLAPFSLEAIHQALVVWRLVDQHGGESPIADRAPTLTTATTLMAWWTTLQQGQTPWAVALGALEQMLLPGPDPS